MAASKVERTEAQRFIAGFELANVVVALAAALVAYLVVGPGPLHLGVVVGGLLSVLNLRAMVWLGWRLIHAPRHTKTRYAILFVAKLGVLGLLVWGALAALAADPLGLMIGFSSILPSILIMAVKKSLDPLEVARKGEQL